jgi:hypothetical protein
MPKVQCPTSLFAVVFIFVLVLSVSAQEPRSAEQKADAAKKANARPIEETADAPEPFDGASVEKMAATASRSKLSGVQSRLK